MRNAVLLAACVLCVTGTWASGQPVTSLPDLEGQPPEGLYSGYLNISGRHYYYVFARAQSQPDKRPFVFWTNGELGTPMLPSNGPTFSIASVLASRQ